MISKLEELKAFLRKEGGGGGNGGGGGDGGGDGGGFSGTVSTVDSSGFVPTYGGGGKKKKPDKTKVTKGSESFAKELLDFAIEESEQLNKAKDMRNTALGQSSPSGDNSKYTRHADIGRNSQHRVLSPPEVPLQHDAVLNWEELFQKSEMVDLQITAKVLIRDSAGQLLILKDRSSDWWDLPGGHIHEDETPEEGALREVEEETGLKLNDAFLVMGAEVDTDIGHKLALFLVSSITVEAPKPLISEEHSDFAWVRLEDSRYYNLGVWAPIVEHLMSDPKETQSEIPDSLSKAALVNTEDNGDKTLLTADGVYLVKSNRTLFKQEPWETPQNENSDSDMEEEDFLEKIINRYVPQNIRTPKMFYRKPTLEHMSIIHGLRTIVVGSPNIDDPPPPNSGEVFEQLEELQVISRALKPQDRIRLEQALDESDDTLLKPFELYTASHGLDFSEQAGILRNLVRDTASIVMEKKYAFNFPRPWQYQMGEPDTIVGGLRPSIQTPSYPSGHSTQAVVISEFLGRVFPDHVDNFRIIAENIGTNRVKAGWHFPMDHVAGKKLGLDIMDLVPMETSLEKDRVYLKPGEESPEGVKVETGPSGGKFYDAEVSPGMAELDTSDRPKTTDDLKYEGLDTPSRHPDRVPGGTTEWDRLMNYEIDSEGNGYGERTLKAIGMDSEEWDDKFASQWVTDSDDEQYGEAWISNSLEGHAVALQYAASDIFSSDKSRMDKMAKHFRTDMLTDEEVHGDQARKKAAQYLSDTYANTQRSFEERGIKELELYRGVKTGGQAGVKAGERIGMKDLPLSSWTADPSTANGFGDTVVSRKFDVRDIVMSMMDKMPSAEFEFVVHTPDQGFESTVQSVSYTDQR